MGENFFTHADQITQKNICSETVESIVRQDGGAFPVSREMEPDESARERSSLILLMKRFDGDRATLRFCRDIHIKA